MSEVKTIVAEICQALKDIAEGCSFPEDAVQEAVLSRVRPLIEKADRMERYIDDIEKTICEFFESGDDDYLRDLYNDILQYEKETGNSED